MQLKGASKKTLIFAGREDKICKGYVSTDLAQPRTVVLAAVRTLLYVHSKFEGRLF